MLLRRLNDRTSSWWTKKSDTRFQCPRSKRDLSNASPLNVPPGLTDVQSAAPSYVPAILERYPPSIDGCPKLIKDIENSALIFCLLRDREGSVSCVHRVGGGGRKIILVLYQKTSTPTGFPNHDPNSSVSFSFPALK